VTTNPMAGSRREPTPKKETRSILAKEDPESNAGKRRRHGAAIAALADKLGVRQRDFLSQTIRDLCHELERRNAYEHSQGRRTPWDGMRLDRSRNLEAMLDMIADFGHADLLEKFLVEHPHASDLPRAIPRRVYHEPNPRAIGYRVKLVALDPTGAPIPTFNRAGNTFRYGEEKFVGGLTPAMAYGLLNDPYLHVTEILPPDEDAPAVRRR